MTNKIRLYRGPFNGKVLEHREAGANEILIRGPKPMSRKEIHLATLRHFQDERSYSGPYLYPRPWEHPIVEARYRLVKRLHMPVGQSWNSKSPLLGQIAFTEAVCMHPDGSLFYEWIKPDGRSRNP